MQLKRLTKQLKLKHEKCNKTRQQAKGNWFCKGRAQEGKEKKKKKKERKKRKSRSTKRRDLVKKEISNFLDWLDCEKMT